MGIGGDGGIVGGDGGIMLILMLMFMFEFEFIFDLMFMLGGDVGIMEQCSW